MLILFLAGALFCWWAEAAAATRFIHQHGVAVADGNMEGKEVRFGIFNSALFATVTTDASCGAVNFHARFLHAARRTGAAVQHPARRGRFSAASARDFTACLIFVVLAVFIAGLMVGRTPEYLGKKIEAYDVKMAMLCARSSLALTHPRLHRLGVP